MLDACIRSQSWIRRARALEQDAKKLIDMTIS
jgi:hypothetical protein